MRENIKVNLHHRQLFLDDEGVSEYIGLAKTMHQPTKKGAVIRPNLTKEGSLQIRSAPAWDPNEQVFKLLVFGNDGGYSGAGYVESADGIHWTKPNMMQKCLDGNANNFFVTVDPELDWPQNAIINMIYDCDENDPMRRFKALGYCTDTHRLIFDRQPLVSPDCKHWKKLDVPLISGQDESNLSYDRETHTYIMTIKKTGPYGRAVFLSTSKDFENWTDPELLFSADKTDQELGLKNIERRLNCSTLVQPVLDIPETYNVDVYNMGVFRYEDYYIGLPAMYHQTGKVGPDWDGFDNLGLGDNQMKYYRQYGAWEGFHHMQLISTRDLKSWNRLGERKPFIDCSPTGAGAYDLSTVLGTSAPVLRGNELWFYYTGLKKYGMVQIEKDGGAICLAVLRRDGFISLDAVNDDGNITTKPFQMPEGGLHLNIEAAKGSAEVAVTDTEGNRIPGFEESRAITGDQHDARVIWGNEKLESQSGKIIRLSITLRNARLYSWWIG